MTGKIGAPTIYTKELGEQICNLIATHTVGYMTIREMYPDICPARATIFEWRKAHPEFADNYLIAKAAQAELMMDEVDEFLPKSILYYNDDDGNLRMDSPSVSAVIAKINTRKWMATRLAPKIFANKEAEQEKENPELQDELRKLREELERQNKREY